MMRLSVVYCFFRCVYCLPVFVVIWRLPSPVKAVNGIENFDSPLPCRNSTGNSTATCFRYQILDLEDSAPEILCSFKPSKNGRGHWTHSLANCFREVA
jgi:hypothetical protein